LAAVVDSLQRKPRFINLRLIHFFVAGVSRSGFVDLILRAVFRRIVFLRRRRLLLRRGMFLEVDFRLRPVGRLVAVLGRTIVAVGFGRWRRRLLLPNRVGRA
jgi:hypothetical protein